MPPANDTEPSDPDTITGSLSRRFYLPIILQQSLLKVIKKDKPIWVLNGPEASFSDRYDSFVNTLGHVCDSTEGGDTVTAFAILSHLGVVQYHFTSNRRDALDYDRTSDFITDILNTLGKATDEEVGRGVPNGTPSEVFKWILLEKILRFNQSRIKGYIHSLNMNVRFCFISARGDSSEDAPVIVENLERLEGLLRQLFALRDGATGLNFDDDVSITVIQAVIRALNIIYTPQFKEYLLTRTQNTTDPDAPWVIVGHSIGRLLSYYYDVDILSTARRQFRRNLFEDFEVHWIPSADMHHRRLPKIPRSKLDAAMIIRNMCHGSLKSELTEYAARIERSGISLNAEISRIAYTTRACVHAEVNLHGHILRLLRDQDATVFYGTPYIGCSKPTCRLCELWFDNHPSQVRMRVRVFGRHNNLYPEWHPPFIHEQAESEVRDATLNRMIPLICDQAAADLWHGCMTRSLNHSNDVETYLQLTRPWMGTDVVSTEEMDDIVSTVGELVVKDGEERGEDVVA